MSFLRHGEIYRPDGNGRDVAAPGHRCDEFPAGYSLAGCSPAEPASASPAGFNLSGPIRRDKRFAPNGTVSLVSLSQAWGPVHILDGRVCFQGRYCLALRKIRVCRDTA